MIELQNIEKSFGEQKVLTDVNIKVNSGEIFGLLGPSGAGKTTIINILTKQEIADSGTWHLGASAIETGLMLDEDGFNPKTSAYQNLELYAGIYGVKKEHISKTLAQVGLSEAAKKPVAKLSKGMRQRLGLARAILHNPKILFLDEPTSGLDPSTAKGIHELIRGLQQNGATIFMTTHNMQEAVELCDYVALLNKGVIVEEGTPYEVCERYNAFKTVPDLGQVFIQKTGVALV
ncbi:MAG: ABC transporter ATP-binding protein [Streptococcaceae bacterium]|jgi:ABC-2 type transport system ATP-binding protein|nr:ABC transporter ATP-binding protein [Streptococcaceae bacterium]